MKALNQQAFTITEILVSLAIGSMLIILMFAVTIGLYGDQLKASTRSEMTLESQLFLRGMVEDIRRAGNVLTTNALADPNQPAGGWVTSDPANILILTYPATDASGEFVIDPGSRYPFVNELVYYSSGTEMRKRLIANPAGQLAGSADVTTCPPAAASVSCPEDALLTNHLTNLLFTFFDIDNAETAIPDEAYSVNLTVNLSRQLYGQDISVSNSIQATMRNRQSL